MSGTGTDFRSVVAGLVQTGIGILGTLTEPVVYTVTSTSTYDPVTGTSTNDVAIYPFNAVAAKFKANEADDKVDIETDLKLIVSALDLPVEPTLDDHCVLLNGRNFTVQRNMGVPGASVWLIHIRES